MSDIEDATLKVHKDEINWLIGEWQRLQPGGSPPPGGHRELVQWIRVSVAERITGLEATARDAVFQSVDLGKKVSDLERDNAHYRARIPNLESEIAASAEPWRVQSAMLASISAQRDRYLDALETTLSNVRSIKAASPGVRLYDEWERMLCETLNL